jgi:hypothetical protein
MRIALMDVATREIRPLDLFPTGKHIDPKFSPDGRWLYFVSDADGFTDVYRVELATGEIERITRLATGVSGVTSLSPALTWRAGRGTSCSPCSRRGTSHLPDGRGAGGARAERVTERFAGVQHGGRAAAGGGGGPGDRGQLPGGPDPGAAGPRGVPTGAVPGAAGAGLRGRAHAGRGGGPVRHGHRRGGGHVLERHAGRPPAVRGGPGERRGEGHRRAGLLPEPGGPVELGRDRGPHPVPAPGVGVPAGARRDGHGSRWRSRRSGSSRTRRWAWWSTRCRRRGGGSSTAATPGTGSTWRSSGSTTTRSRARRSGTSGGRGRGGILGPGGGDGPPGPGLGGVRGRLVQLRLHVARAGRPVPVRGGAHHRDHDGGQRAGRLPALLLVNYPFTLAVRGMHFGRYGPDAEEGHPLFNQQMFLGYPTLVRGYQQESFTQRECVDGGRTGGTRTARYSNRLLGLPDRRGQRRGPGAAVRRGGVRAAELPVPAHRAVGVRGRGRGVDQRRHAHISSGTTRWPAPRW